MGGSQKSKLKYTSVPWSFVQGYNENDWVRVEQKRSIWKRLRVKIVVLNPRLVRWTSAPIAADVVAAGTYLSQQAGQNSGHHIT